ncbi:MAG: hypothetical protein ACRD4Y_03520 [Candidatus Acidiferrales bacterium]
MEGRRANQSSFSEQAHTVIVNAHGALVEMGTSLETGQSVTLRNSRTSEEIESTVKLVTAGDPGKFHVALEFNAPSPGFWHISFPPDDWEAHRLDVAKKP